MKRGNLGQAVKDVSGGGGGDFLDLKDVGTAVIHIHSNADVGDEAEVEERMVAWVPAEPDADQGGGGKGGRRKRTGGHKRRFSYLKSEGCVFVDFLEALEADKSIGDDEVVLSADGQDYTKDDILGGGDWQLDLRPNAEFLFAVVASSLGDDKVSEPKLQVLAAKPSLAKAIDGVIDAQVREHGAAGEASVGQYGIEITYNEDASPRDKYKAAYNGRKPSAAVRALLDGDGIDLLKLCKSNNLDEMADLLREALQVSIAGFDLEPGVEREARGGKAGGRKGPAARAAERGGKAGGGKAGAGGKAKEEPPARGGRRPVAPPPEDEEDDPSVDADAPAEDEEEDEEERALREAEEEMARKKAELARKKAEKEAAAKKEAGAKKGAGKPPADAAGGGDSSEIQCPKCGEQTTVSPSQKSCTHCGHKIIPW